MACPSSSGLKIPGFILLNITENIQLQSFTHARDKDLTDLENKEVCIFMTKNNNKKMKDNPKIIAIRSGWGKREEVCRLLDTVKPQKNQYWHKMKLFHPPCFVFYCPIEYWHCAYITKT